jgi:hypothetical protein
MAKSRAVGLDLNMYNAFGEPRVDPQTPRGVPVDLHRAGLQLERLIPRSDYWIQRNPFRSATSFPS